MVSATIHIKITHMNHANAADAMAMLASEEINQFGRRGGDAVPCAHTFHVENMTLLIKSTSQSGEEFRALLTVTCEHHSHIGANLLSRSAWWPAVVRHARVQKVGVAKTTQIKSSRCHILSIGYFCDFYNPILKVNYRTLE